ncbi:hypothetical protein TNCV_3392481 [Trichonephila clavipes]|nr:hypothetical protein TNCV_3392481 [Trichonephila clavipes]
MRPDRRCQTEAHESPRSKVLVFKSVVSHNFKHHTGDRTIWLGSIPILRDNTVEVVSCYPPLDIASGVDHMQPAKRFFSFAARQDSQKIE